MLCFIAHLYFHTFKGCLYFIILNSKSIVKYYYNINVYVTNLTPVPCRRELKRFVKSELINWDLA